MGLSIVISNLRISYSLMKMMQTCRLSLLTLDCHDVIRRVMPTCLILWVQHTTCHLSYYGASMINHVMFGLRVLLPTSSYVATPHSMVIPTLTSSRQSNKPTLTFHHRHGHM